MRRYPVEDIAEKPDEKESTKAAYRVLYDGQCEICQACVSWLKTIDRENKTVCLPIRAHGRCSACHG
jgi:predicted DCC family thiol-disulfide oxidoreductase YuxK